MASRGHRGTGRREGLLWPGHTPCILTLHQYGGLDHGIVRWSSARCHPTGRLGEGSPPYFLQLSGTYNYLKIKSLVE